MASKPAVSLVFLQFQKYHTKMLCELTKPFKGPETERRELLQRSNIKDIVPVEDSQINKAKRFAKQQRSNALVCV